MSFFMVCHCKIDVFFFFFFFFNKYKNQIQNFIGISTLCKFDLKGHGIRFFSNTQLLDGRGITSFIFM